MRVDVLALQRFYASPLGEAARRAAARRLTALVVPVRCEPVELELVALALAAEEPRLPLVAEAVELLPAAVVERPVVQPVY